MTTNNSLDKRLAYLAIADFDYLSSRILLLFGLANTGFPKAAEAFEKLFKLFLMIEAKINRNEEMSYAELKQDRHKLVTMFGKIKQVVPVNFDKSYEEYFMFLQESYNKRYPEHWDSFKYLVDIEKLDVAYLYFRRGVVTNLPVEDQISAKQFGGFISHGYIDTIKEIIKKRTGRSLKDMLLQDNDHIGQSDIFLDNL